MYRSSDKEACERWCGQIAAAENYSLMRCWAHGEHEYRDCGPRTFVITSNPAGLTPTCML